MEQNTWQAEVASNAASVSKDYDWHWLAKDVADFTNINFFDVYERQAIEIFSTIMIMQARVQYNGLKKY